MNFKDEQRDASRAHAQSLHSVGRKGGAETVLVEAVT